MRRPETNESTRARNEAPRGSPSSRRTTKRTRGERKRSAANRRLTRSIARVSPFRYRTTRASSICRVVRARARASRRRHNTRNHHRVHASRAPTGRKALEAPDRRSATFGVPREISQRRRARVRRAALSRHRSSASGAVPPSARRALPGLGRHPRRRVTKATRRRRRRFWTTRRAAVWRRRRRRSRASRRRGGKSSPPRTPRARLRRTGKRSAPLRTARAGWVTCSRSTARSEVRARSRPHAGVTVILERSRAAENFST